MTSKIFLSCRTPALFALALMVGLLLQSIGAPAYGSAATNSTVVHVIEHSINDTIVDNGTPGDSLGDLLVFANPLYDKSDKLTVGRDSGSCVRTAVGTAYECNWTVFLNNGQISVEGPYYDNSDSTLSIIGGTGIYNHARGQMLLHARNLAGTEYDYTYYLS